MTTPKKERLSGEKRKLDHPSLFVEAELLDRGFDDESAAMEFVDWIWPERRNAE